MCAALFAFYALYLPFDSWTYTRFLLPVLPLAFVLAAIVVVAGLGLGPAFARVPATILSIVAVLCFGLGRARQKTEGQRRRRPPSVHRNRHGRLPSFRRPFDDGGAASAIDASLRPARYVDRERRSQR